MQKKHLFTLFYLNVDKEFVHSVLAVVEGLLSSFSSSGLVGFVGLLLILE